MACLYTTDHAERRHKLVSQNYHSHPFHRAELLRGVGSEGPKAVTSKVNPLVVSLVPPLKVNQEVLVIFVYLKDASQVPCRAGRRGQVQE